MDIKRDESSNIWVTKVWIVLWDFSCEMSKCQGNCTSERKIKIECKIVLGT